MSDPLPQPAPTPSAETPSLILPYDRYDPGRDRRGFVRVVIAFWLGILLSGLLNASVHSSLVYLAPRLVGRDLFDVLVNCLGITIIGPLFCAPALVLSLYLQRRIKRDVRFARWGPAIACGMAYALPLPSTLIYQVWDYLPTVLSIILLVGWYLLFPIIPSFWICYRSHLRDD